MVSTVWMRILKNKAQSHAISYTIYHIAGVLKETFNRGPNLTSLPYVNSQWLQIKSVTSIITLKPIFLLQAATSTLRPLEASPFVLRFASSLITGLHLIYNVSVFKWGPIWLCISIQSAVLIIVTDIPFQHDWERDQWESKGWEAPQILDTRTVNPAKSAKLVIPIVPTPPCPHALFLLNISFKFAFILMILME